MRPATASDRGPGLWPALHLLDLSRVGENYVSMLVECYGGKNISTQRHNLKLPPEIWYMIVERLRDDERDESGRRRKGDYCFVRVSPFSTSNSNSGDDTNNNDGNGGSSGTSSQHQEQQTCTIVRCTRYNVDEGLDLYGVVAGHLRSARAVDIFEEFLASPDTFDKDDPEYTNSYSLDRAAQDIDEIIPELVPTEEVFDIMLPLAPSQQDDDEEKNNNNLIIPCLYTQVEVQDVIAFIDKGDCFACHGGEREICPGCTGGLAQAFYLFAGCDYTIACPLCIGQGLAEEHRQFNRSLDGLSEEEADELEEELMERIRGRKRKLGYL